MSKSFVFAIYGPMIYTAPYSFLVPFSNLQCTVRINFNFTITYAPVLNIPPKFFEEGVT
jgi:hypothetical protein